MKVKNTLLIIKVLSLVFLGLLMVIGSFGFSVTGGLWACPFPIPFIMCNVCPVYCTFGQVRVWLFYGILATGLVTGRAFCGVFCPMGIAQELMAKVPLKKISLPRGFTHKFYQENCSGELESVLRSLKLVKEREFTLRL